MALLPMELLFKSTASPAENLFAKLTVKGEGEEAHQGENLVRFHPFFSLGKAERRLKCSYWVHKNETGMRNVDHLQVTNREFWWEHWGENLLSANSI